MSGSLSATGKSPSAAVIDSAGKFLFVANRGSGDVSAFAIDGKNETLREVKGSPFKTGRGAAAIAIDLTGSYLFVADHQANDIASLQIDNETGVLTLLGRTPLLSAGPSALAVDPSGQYLHVTSDKTGGVTTLRLDVATGTLVPAGETTTRERRLLSCWAAHSHHAGPVAVLAEGMERARAHGFGTVLIRGAA